MLKELSPETNCRICVLRRQAWELLIEYNRRAIKRSFKTPSASDEQDSAAERKTEDRLESPLPDCNSDQDL